MKSWGLDRKVIFLLSIFIVVGGSSTYLGINRIGVLKDSMDQIVQNNVVILQKAQELKSLYNTQLINEKNFILENNSDDLATHKKYMSQRDQQIQSVIKDIESVKIGNETKADLEQFKKYGLEWVMLMDQIESFKRSGEQAKAIEITKVQGRELRLKVSNLLDQIIERNLAIMNNEVRNSNELYSSSRNLMSSISIFGFIFGLFIAATVFLATKKIIRGALENLTKSTQSVKANSEQLKETSVEISSATAEQASSIQETASAIEELTSMVKKNADNAQDASELAGKSSDSAEKGRIVVQDMIKAIGEISTSNDKMVESINHSNEQISDIVKVISEIGGKTKVINDIVFQTKLLAFNASVEAARAGEHGKGFAVVAEEVGNLAEMSGKASSEISSLLENSIKKVQSIVDDTSANITTLVKESNLKVDAGTDVANECGRVLSEIVANVQKVAGMANEISSASQEQSLGVQEITKAMNILDEATQSNAATAEQSSSTALGLNQQAQNLEHIFNILAKALEGANSDFLIKGNSNTPSSENRTESTLITDTEESHSEVDNVLPMNSSLLDKPVERKTESESSHAPHEEDDHEEVQWVSLDDDGEESEEDDFKVI